MAAEEKYRRLPGRRRIPGSSASLWMASDHILLVRSSWFREEYKRFYLRDIQAIVVAPCARYQVTTPMLWFAVAWVFALTRVPAAAWGVASMVLVAAWLYVSLRESCRCRIYTAVSKDDLSSLSRTWTAGRFLRQVQPLIEQVQGAMAANWAEADSTSAGPAMAPMLAAMAPPEPPPVRPRRAHTLAADLFVLSLFLGAVVGLGTVHSSYAGWFQINSGLTLLQLVGAIAVLVQYARGSVGRAMQRLAIAAMVLIGVTFYVQTLTYSFNLTNASVLGKGTNLIAPRPVIIAHEATNAMELLLSFVGAAIILRAAYGRDPDIIRD
jgi:hypothetical protein